MSRTTPTWMGKPTSEMQAAGWDRDEHYFAQHPNVTVYDRPATPEELALTAYRPDTWVRVCLIGGSLRARVFYVVDGRLN